MVGYVFLPDHIHMIITPMGSSNFSQVMHSLKTNFTKNYKGLCGIPSSQTVRIWQKRFWDHVLRDDRDIETHLHYIHFNPVKHELAEEPQFWEDSSYREWEKRGLYSPSFTWEEPTNNLFGE
jgi:putative transposase